MNKAHDDRALEREHITTDVSMRELCRRHNTGAHAMVVVQAQKNDWAGKREQHKAKASDALMARDRPWQAPSTRAMPPLL